MEPFDLWHSLCIELIAFRSGKIQSCDGFCYQVIDKSFGFDTAVEEAQRAINAAHVEAESAENGIGVVKLMGRYCGKMVCVLQYVVISNK